MSSDPTVGLVSADKAATEALLKSARGRMKFFPIDVGTAATADLVLDAIILVFGEPPETSVRFFAECIETVPHIPILGVSSLDSAHVVELLKCGMADHLTPPIDSDLLQRKLTRMIGHEAGTVLDSVVLDALPRSLPIGRKNSLRKCARASVPVGLPVNLRLVDHGAHIKVLDLSVPTREAPGGLCGEVDAGATKRLSVLLRDNKSMVPVQIMLPAHVSPQVVPARARIVHAVAGGGGATRIGMQFWLDRMRDEGLLQRFWIKCHVAQRSRAQVKK